MPPSDISYVQADDLKEIAVRWKNKFPINMENVDIDRIDFIRCIGSKQKKHYAITKKLDDLTKYLNGNFDYVIIFYDHLIEEMGPGNLSVLVGHELLHIGGFDGNKFSLIDHDVKDHRTILVTFGVDWAVDETLEDPTLKDDVTLAEPVTTFLEEDNIRFDTDEMG